MKTRARRPLALSALAVATGLVLVSLVPMAAQAAAVVYTVTATIPVGSYPNGVAVDAAANTVYVANLFGDSVSVIDQATGAVTSTIAVGANPYGIAVNAATNTIYVANYGSGSVSVIDGVTGAVTSTIPVGTNPIAIAVNAARNTVFVANRGGNSVSVIDGVTGAVTSTIPAGTNPIAIAVNAVTNTVYVANQNGDSVSVIDGATGAVTSTVPVGSSPTGIAVNAVTGTVFVTNAGSDSVSVIDSATDTVTSTVLVGANPTGIAVNVVTNTIYLANELGGSVSVISALAVAPAITTGSLPAGTAGSAYGSTVDASGYPAPVFTVSSGTLPGGVVLDATTGAISGTPTAAGSATFTITATNSAGTDSRTFTVTVVPAAVAPVVMSGSLPAGEVGSAYSSTVTASGSPAPVFTVSSGTLPAGLVLDAATGTVSGIPATAGSATFTITATNSAGSDSKVYTVAIAAAAVAPAITAGALPDGTVGAAYSSTVTASGSPAPAFSVTAGALPAGLVLDAASGVVSGIPTAAGSATFTITATNSAASDSQTYTVAVAVAPAAAAPVTVTVTFDSDGHGTAPAAQVLPSRGTAIRPADPTAAGLSFTGWFTDPSLATRVDFEIPVTVDTTYYAGWATLARTGVSLDPLAITAALALLVLGILLVTIASRRRNRHRFVVGGDA
jgi:YVTN family beta-propeller protein